MKTNSFFSRSITALLLLLALAARAQVTNAPKTYFEESNATVDAVLVKGMSSVGTLSGQITFPVEIRAEELRNVQSSNVLYGVAVRTTFKPHQTQTDYIDYDELDGLIHAIGTIKAADRSVTPLDNFDIIFQTRSGLSIAKISRGGRASFVLRSGDPSAEHNVMEAFALESFGMYLSTAKAKLDLLRQSR